MQGALCSCTCFTDHTRLLDPVLKVRLSYDEWAGRGAVGTFPITTSPSSEPNTSFIAVLTRSMANRKRSTRWRGGGRHNDQDRQSIQQRQSATLRDGAKGNAQQSGRRAAGGRGQNQNKQVDNAPNGPSSTPSNRIEATPAPPQEDHVPLNSFNAQEVKAALRQLPEPKPVIFKPTEKAPQTSRSGAPWASKRESLDFQSG